MAVAVAPGLKMIAHHHRVEVHRLGVHTELQQLSGAELFSRRLVSELEHCGMGFFARYLARTHRVSRR